ncbi:MAG: helix-turn-helix transcriptional regulator [bacterium]|nr:helix-turn-helix transcriptional regulator [bacterium]
MNDDVYRALRQQWKNVAELRLYMGEEWRPLKGVENIVFVGYQDTVSQKVLTAQLRQMEESGLVIRTVYPEVPPRAEYTLTEPDYRLKPILGAIWNWGEAYSQHT